MKARPRSRAKAAPDPSVARRAHLRHELLATVDLLQRRRADLVPAAIIAEYVEESWLEWSGGSLKLTEVGVNICKQLRAGMV